MTERRAPRVGAGRSAAAMALAAVLATGAAAQGIETRSLGPLTPTQPTGPAPDRRTDEGATGRIDASRTNERTDTFRELPLSRGDGAASEGEQQGYFERAPRFFDHPPPPERLDLARTEERPGAVLRQLDKMTGGIRTVEVGTGEIALIDRLSIRLVACDAPPDDATKGTRAFLQIRDTRRPDAKFDFSGWMFADSPALSALDHPRYDVWVIRCTMASGGSSSASE